VKKVMNCSCRKMLGISGVAEELSVSHEGLRYMGLLFVIWDCLRLCPVCGLLGCRIRDYGNGCKSPRTL
jgi:hypothetical protein